MSSSRSLAEQSYAAVNDRECSDGWFAHVRYGYNRRCRLRYTTDAAACVSAYPRPLHIQHGVAANNRRRYARTLLLPSHDIISIILHLAKDRAEIDKPRISRIFNTSLRPSAPNPGHAKLKYLLGFGA